MQPKRELLVLSVPCAPIRTKPADAAEMCSEALAGEAAYILETGEKDWIQIELVADGYRGWSDRKQWRRLDADEQGNRALKPFRIQAPTSPWVRKDGGVIHLPAGSVVDLDEASHWSLTGIAVTPLFSLDELFEVHQNPLDAACSFLGAPYRWGGRCISGIDCSGLMQVAFLLCGQRLPRDASQQAQEGQPIAWSERKSGDLAFFNNDEGRIIHVGILKDERTILHAAGEVAMDTLSEEGIWRDGKRTHALDFIRRMK